MLLTSTKFKGCLRYIFASLFCKSKGEHLWNKEKYFLFQFKNSFRSWDNQIKTFQIFKRYDVINTQAWNRKHILLNNLGNKHILVIKFSQFMQHYKRKILIKKFYKKCTLNTSSRSFLIKKGIWGGLHADLDKFW